MHNIVSLETFTGTKLKLMAGGSPLNNILHGNSYSAKNKQTNNALEPGALSWLECLMYVFITHYMGQIHTRRSLI